MDLITPGIGLMFWQTLIFLLVLWLLAKFAWKPIMGAIKEREESISNSLEQAENARREMEKLTADNEKILADARMERDKMILNAKDTSEKMIREARDKAKEEGKRELIEAKEAIQNERLAAVTEIRNMIGDLSVGIAEKILRENLEGDGQKNYTKKYLDEIKLS